MRTNQFQFSNATTSERADYSGVDLHLGAYIFVTVQTQIRGSSLTT